jgi:uncharacterized membrane protein
MYEAIVLIHVVAILVFAGAHLVSGVAMFQARSEGDRGRLTAVLGRSSQALIVAVIALLVALITGVVLAFMGELWGRLWIWASIGLIVVVGGLMTPMATIPMNQLRGALGMQVGKPKEGEAAPVPHDDATVAAARAKLRPEMVAVIGVVGYLAIVWLMMSKPF